MGGQLRVFSTTLLYMTTIIHKASSSRNHHCTHLFKKIGTSLILKFDCLWDYCSNLSNVSPVPASLCDSSEVLLYHSTTRSDDLLRLLEIMLQSKSVSIVAVATRPLCPLYHLLVHTQHWIKMKIYRKKSYSAVFSEHKKTKHWPVTTFPSTHSPSWPATTPVRWTQEKQTQRRMSSCYRFCHRLSVKCSNGFNRIPFRRCNNFFLLPIICQGLICFAIALKMGTINTISHNYVPKILSINEYWLNREQVFHSMWHKCVIYRDSASPWNQ